MNIEHNGEHVHPLPTQDISESQDTQTTHEIRNTNAGSGLHDADCCASSFVDMGWPTSTECEVCKEPNHKTGIRFKDKDRPHMFWVCCGDHLRKFIASKNDKRYSGILDLWNRTSVNDQWKHHQTN